MERESRYLTDDIFTDYLNNETSHDIYSRRKSIEMLKSLKLVFYKDTEDAKLREKYLNYYMEVHPVFEKRYLKANNEEREKMLENAIKRAKIIRDDFVSHNFRLVVNIALKEYKKFPNLQLEKIDLIQEGNLGMLKAIEKFDIDTGNAFSTYAIWWIRSYIQRYIIQRGRTIHLPANILDYFRDYSVAREVLSNKLGKTPTLEEIADYMNEPVYKIEEIVRYKNQFQNVNSLNEPVIAEEDDEIGAFIPDNSKSVENEVEEKIFSEEFNNFIEQSNLTDREKEILIKRNGLYGGEIYTLEKLGQCYGITRERVRQIEYGAIRKLQKTLNEGKYDFEVTDNYDYKYRPLIEKDYSGKRPKSKRFF